MAADSCSRLLNCVKAISYPSLIFLRFCEMIVNYRNDNPTLVKGLRRIRRSERLLAQTESPSRLSRQDPARTSRREVEDTHREEVARNTMTEAIRRLIRGRVWRLCVLAA